MASVAVLCPGSALGGEPCAVWTPHSGDVLFTMAGQGVLLGGGLLARNLRTFKIAL